MLLSLAKKAAQETSQVDSALLALLWLLLLTATQHTAEYGSEQVAHATLLGIILSGTHENLGDAAEVEPALVAGFAQYAHYDGRENRHQFHHLAHIQAGRLADLLRHRLLLIAQNVSKNTGSIGSVTSLIALEHSAYHTHEVVYHTSVMVAVERGTERRKAAFGADIICQATQQSSENTIRSNGSLFRLCANMFADLTDDVIG